MSHLKGQNFWDSDNGKSFVIKDPTKPFYIRLACQPNTGYSWTFTSTKSVEDSASSSSMTVIDNEHIETGEFTIRRRYYGKGKFTGETDNAAVLGGGGGYVFIVSPHLDEIMRGVHHMTPGKRITLTFSYARPWTTSSNDKTFSITVEGPS